MGTSEMASVPASVNGREESFRQAEQAFWGQYGLAPREQFVEVGSPAVRLRVQEVGSGQPVLFVHGTGGSGAYFAPLVRELQSFRCLVLDRPGWGLSEEVNFSGRPYTTVVSDLLGDTLDALGVDRAHLVGGSIGDLWALRFAQAQPSRVERIVLLGGGPLTAEVAVPPFIRLLRTPLGQILVRIPENRKMLRKQLRAIGHAESLSAGRITDAFLDWHVAMSRHTDWARHGRDMVRAIVGRRGFMPGLVLHKDEVAGIEQPTLMVFGTRDPNGSVGIWKRFVGQLPRGELELVDGGGHVVWLDDPPGVGGRVMRFLSQ